MSNTQPNLIQILLIEDNPADAYLIQELLNEAMANRSHPTQFNLTHAARLKEGITYTHRSMFDVVLLDLSLPDSHGLATFTQLYNSIPNIPIILLTGLNDELLAVEAMQQGAQDYLVKGEVANGTLLIRSIRYAIERQRLVAELSQKAAELEARNAALDAFSHTMAHQIRGPLSQVIGYAEFAQMSYKDKLDEELYHMLGRILQSSLKMNNMMSELLLLASVRSQNEFDMHPLEMGRIVAEARKRLRLQIEEYKAKIILPTSWPLANGYGPWIEEVWVNYISNGLKYGGQPPELTLGANPAENDMICFWVRDNGQGISKEDQKRLFKPHSRLHESHVKGEGVGLSIVWRIIRRCGGNVGVNSQLNQGSTFWFTLPAAAAETSAS